MLAMIVIIAVMVVAVAAFELCMSCPHHQDDPQEESVSR